ncbi:MAG TPA: hypothetical protein DCM49_08350 [Lachnospiraceae bacterium]|nr:hypothetical protein [Lachnospiraceae bacterium]
MHIDKDRLSDQPAHDQMIKPQIMGDQTIVFIDQHHGRIAEPEQGPEQIRLQETSDQVLPYIRPSRAAVFHNVFHREPFRDSLRQNRKYRLIKNSQQQSDGGKDQYHPRSQPVLLMQNIEKNGQRDSCQ